MLTIAESEARSLYDRAGFTLADTPGMHILACCILGASHVVSHTGLTTPGRYLPKQGEIWLRAGLPPRRAAYVLAHELAEMTLTELDYRESDREAQCDAIAAALVCPRDAFRSAVRAVGADLPQLAEGFITTESVSLLRIGETTGRPVVLVGERIHARGEAFEWGNVTELRRIARVGAPGLERRELTDVRRRVGLLAA